MVDVVVTLGHVEARPSGLHFRTPIMSTTETLSTKTQLLEENMSFQLKKACL